MKIFTLSAVCVLVYGLLIALSGTTSFPGSSDERNDVIHQQVASLFDSTLAVSVSPKVEDWDGTGPVVEDGREGGQGGFLGKNKVIRLLGIMFILVWIYLSVRLLSAD